MAAAYDTYDYPAYWEGREYEHSSEITAIKSFLEKIPEISTLLEIGAGFGRLTPSYLHRAKKIIISDPSAKLLGLARKSFSETKGVEFIHSKIENISDQLRSKSADVLILVRVLHHIENAESAIKTANTLLKDKGYLVIEFANKCHFKASFLEFLKGNFTFLLDIFPSDKRSLKPKKKSILPFKNYHPDAINTMLADNGFKIIQARSVSNIRSPLLKKILPTDTLVAIEKLIQIPLAKFNFGPSIFILCQKVS